MENEPKFCIECGRKLNEVVYNGRIWLDCPKRNAWIVINPSNHTSFLTGRYRVTPKYDPQTGVKL